MVDMAALTTTANETDKRTSTGILLIALALGILLPNCSTTNQARDLNRDLPFTSDTPLPVANPTPFLNEVMSDKLIRRDEFESARSLWRKRKIEDYDMTVRFRPIGGMGIPHEKVLIQVRGSIAIDTAPLPPGSSGMTFQYSKIDSIEKMFADIETELDIGTEIRGIFNPDFGYPERIYMKFAQRSSAQYAFFVDMLSVHDSSDSLH